jgi:hypothetical protein
MTIGATPVPWQVSHGSYRPPIPAVISMSPEQTVRSRGTSRASGQGKDGDQ